MNQAIPIYLFSVIFSIVSVIPIVLTHFLDRYFNAFNEIDKHNKMWQYDLALDKYWVTKSGYSRLANKVSLGMFITYGKFLFCRGIAEVIADNKISIRDYNNSTVYD